MRGVLILVMSAQRAPWGALMDESLRTWDEMADAMYYLGHKPRRAGMNFIHSPFDEGLLNLGRRTLHAYEYALSLPGWDFIARVNSSCYVHKRKLSEYCAKLPKTGVLCGVEADSKVGFRYLWGGGQYILSRDTVELIAANRSRWNHAMMEDVAVSRLALDLGIEWNGQGAACSINRDGEGYICISYGGESFQFKDFAEFAEKNTNHFIRCKHDPDRIVDLEWFRKLKLHLKP